MNTKGIKFLAVLAVMMMAFAAVIVLAPADKSNDAIVVYGNEDEVRTGITEVSTSDIPTSVRGGAIYVADDVTIKVKTALKDALIIYVQNGKEVNVDFKAEQTGDYAVTIVTVTGDQEYDIHMGASTSSANVNPGKIVLNGLKVGDYTLSDTTFTFYGEKGQSVYYKAAVVDIDFEVNNTSKTIHLDKYKLTKNAFVGADKVFAEGATAGANVTVASGQTIEIADSDATAGGLKYGAMVSTEDSATFYGIGDDIGSLKMYANDKVKFADKGTATLTYGTSAVKLAAVKGLTVTASTDANKFTIEQSLSAGTMTVSGAADFSGFTIASGATATLASKAAITGTITVDGTLIVKTDDMPDASIDGSGIVRAQNAKLWNDTHDAIDCIADSFTGLVDTSAITKVAQVKDEISTSVIAPDQTFELVADTTVYKQLTIDGILIINPGVTLTVDEASLKTTNDGINYKQIINNGKILVRDKTAAGILFNGGYIENNGTIEFLAKKEVSAANVIGSGVYKFVNNGTMTVSKNDAIQLADAVDNKGTIEISGVLATATDFNNYGLVKLSGATIGGSVNVDLDAGAVLKIVSVKMDSGKTITATYGGNTITVNTDASDLSTIRNVTLTGIKTGDFKYIDIDGNMSATIPNNTGNAKSVTVNVKGSATVFSDLNVPNNYAFTFTKTGDYNASLFVYGTVTIAETEKTTGGNLDLYVYGKVTCMKGDSLVAAKYSGAKYMLSDDTTIYTTFEVAVPAAYLSDVKTVMVGDLYPVTVIDDVVIPEDMSIEQESSDSLIIIGSDLLEPVSVTVEESGKINVPVLIVNGALYAEDSSDVYEDEVTAHVKFEGEKDVTFASLNVAISMAQPGQTLVLISDFVMDNSEITIPAGVTVDAIAEEDIAFICIGSNLYVNGTLIVDKFAFVAETDDDIEIVVKGTIMEETTGVNIQDHWFTPTGVSYTDTIMYDDEEKIFFVITDISNLQNAIDNADDAKVTIEGTPALGDISVRGPEGAVAEITFSEDINAGTITMDDVIIKASNGAKINATFANAKGSIVIAGAYVVKDKEFSIYTVDDGAVTMSGPITDSTIASYSIGFYGETGMDDGIIGWGNYVVEENAVPVYPTILFVGDTTAIGKKNAIMNTSDPSDLDYGTVTILGSLTADNNAKIEIIADVDVLGALVAAEKGESGKGAGVITVDGNLFVGTTQAAIWSPEVFEKATGKAGPDAFGKKGTYVPPVGSAAVLSGKIDIADSTKIVVAEDAYVDENIVDDFDYFYITIEDDLWLTIYGKGTFYLDGFLIPVVNCDINSVYDQDLNSVADFSNEYRVLYNSKAITFGVTEWINIGVSYDVFNVLIKTDGSVKAVYIDGILMYTGDAENQFTLSRVQTGTHKVTVEAATGYDANKCVLYTDMGTILPGMAFTFTELDCVIVDGVNTHTVIYNINGTEIQPEPVPPTPEEESQWTVTTILLVILVVLIAIMAVIVALRLNRS